MKYRIALILVLTSLSSSAFAISLSGKEQDIQREISYAENITTRTGLMV